MKTIIETTNKSPEVIADEEKSQIEIKGVIIPENPHDFFDLLNNYIDNTYSLHNKIELIFKLDYFNTSSAKFLFDLLKKISINKNLTISWYYEKDDEDIYDSGKEFENLISAKFNFIEI